MPKFIQTGKFQQDVQAVNKRARCLSSVPGHFCGFPQVPLTPTLGRSPLQKQVPFSACNVLATSATIRPPNLRVPHTSPFVQTVCPRDLTAHQLAFCFFLNPRYFFRNFLPALPCSFCQFISTMPAVVRIDSRIATDVFLFGWAGLPGARPTARSIGSFPEDT